MPTIRSRRPPELIKSDSLQLPRNLLHRLLPLPPKLLVPPLINLNHPLQPLQTISLHRREDTLSSKFLLIYESQTRAQSLPLHMKRLMREHPRLSSRFRHILPKFLILLRAQLRQHFIQSSRVGRSR